MFKYHHHPFYYMERNLFMVLTMVLVTVGVFTPIASAGMHIPNGSVTISGNDIGAAQSCDCPHGDSCTAAAAPYVAFIALLFGAGVIVATIYTRGDIQ